MTLATIVPQRALYDCLPAALATTLGWTYERARAVLGPHVTERGTFLIPLAAALLNERIAGTYLLSRTHPQAANAETRWLSMLSSPAEIRAQIQGHRAIIVVPGLGPEDQAGPEFGHALAWDGQRAIHCGAIGAKPLPAREICLEAVPLWEALILTEVTTPAPAPANVPANSDEEDASLAAVFDRHERVFLGFSGGKESIALAHMLEPWRDRVTLLWVNTGHMAPHMIEFVRSYGDRFALEEIASPNVIEHWKAMGTPAEVFPLANITGTASPRLQPWLHCCGVIRQEPVNAFLRSQPGPCCFINGQRRQDQDGATVAGLKSRLPATVEIAMPLTLWSEGDVFAYIATHGLALPPQYAEGYPDSIECIICPAPMKATRLRYLRRHHPNAADAAVRLSADSTRATLAATLAVMTAANETGEAA